MADKRKGKKRKDEFSLGEEKVEKPSKEEYAVAKWLKKNVPAKRTKFLNHNIEYFTGCKAVDALMDSQWAKEDSETHFSTRVHCVNFLDMMLRHKFFHRAKKVPVSEKELRAKLKKKEKKSTDEKKKDDKEKNKKKEEELAESSHAEGKDEGKEKQDEGDKKKRKIRLEMHLEQLFADGLDAYIWIYDPIPLYYWLFGALLVLAAIGVCLFPLWPPSVRMGVYYLSVAAAGFLMLIIALAALRLVVFCIIWLLTLGKHHLWLFPNLTEDVGFFASFWPLYHYKYTGGNDKASKKKKKDKDSDVEEDDDEDEKEDEDDDSGRSQGEEEGEEKADSVDRGGDAVVDKKEKLSRNGGGEDEEGGGDSETESEGSSQQSQTGKDFEIVDRADIQES